MRRNTKLFLFAALWSLPCFASSGMQLCLYVYSTDSSIGPGPEDFIAEFMLPAQSERDCTNIGNLGMMYAKLGKLPDNSMARVSYSCEPLP